MIRALVFDFDGLILDTESAEIEAWRVVFGEQGCVLRVEDWTDCIGRPQGYFDPVAHLGRESGRVLDREAIRTRFREVHRALVADLAILPGVESLVRDAARRGVPMAVASSSTRDWVQGNLERVGLFPFFQTLVTSEDTDRHKPDPTPYREACSRLDCPPGEALAFEDSPNGVAAAKAAGLFCVAVPNPITAPLPLDGADLRLESLAHCSLEDLLRRFDGNGIPNRRARESTPSPE